MFAIKPRIIHKGIILLAVPLVFEIVAATTLLFLQASYSDAVKAEVLRTEIVHRIKKLWTTNISMTATSLGTSLMGRTLPTRTIERQFADRYAELRELLASDPQQMQRLDEIKNCHDEIRVICDELTQSISSEEGPLRQILALRNNLKTWETLIAKDMHAGNLFRSLKEYQLQQSAQATERVRFLATLIQLVLAGVIIGSVIIAFLLFRFFMQGIHRGVQALILNIQRFKRGEALAPVLEGADELAHLDLRFHEIAEEVASAQRMKQAFINTVSSKLSLPISSTRSELTQLCGGAFGALSAAASDRAQKAKVSLDRLMAMINDLLALQAPGTHQMELVPRQCAMDDVIRRSIDAVSSLAEAKNIQLENTHTDITANVDPDRMVQVLVNLLSNAIKFSANGASVIVSATRRSDHVDIKVEDTGRGVPAHLREAIFERFEQVELTDATQKGGTGLGLPICKEIVQLHGGKIGVDSEEGKGSTFWIQLPVGGPDKTGATSNTPSLRVLPPKSKWQFIARRTIHTKGLLLISIPLIVELAFGSTLFSMQRYYDDKLNKERLGVELFFLANEMWINSTEFILLQAQYTLFGGPRSPVDAKVASFTDQYSALEKLIANDPREQKSLNALKAKVDRILEICKGLQPVDLTNLSLAQMQLLKSDFRLFTRARSTVASLSTESLGNFQYARRKSRIKQLDAETESVNKLVLESLAVSTLVALLLFAYFMRTISQEIDVIVRNTDRFKEGLELEPPMREGDELAQVDAAFHQMAEEIKEAESTKQKIVATISHDLRTPLTSVSGFLSNFTAGVFGGHSTEAVSHMQNCEQNIDRVIQLINDLLDLYKIEAGKFELRTRTLSADEVMDKAINKVFVLADESDVNINPPVGSAQIHCDPDRVIQALANVLSKAVHLSPAGSSIATGVMHGDPDTQIWITAANAQITEDQFNNLFDRYQQADTSLSLELPISKEIIRLHGGAINVRSMEPQGLTFSLRLPSKEQEARDVT